MTTSESMTHISVVSTSCFFSSCSVSLLEKWGRFILSVMPSAICLLVKVQMSLRCVRLFATPWTCPWNSPGQDAGVGSLSLLQGISPTQGLNPGLPHCRWILYQLSHQGTALWLIFWVFFPDSKPVFQKPCSSLFIIYGIYSQLFLPTELLRY